MITIRINSYKKRSTKLRNMAPDDLRDPDGNVGIDNVKDPGIKIY